MTRQLRSLIRWAKSEGTVTSGRRRTDRVVIIPRQLLADAGKFAGRWRLIAHSGLVGSAIDLCDHIGHASCSEAWACSEAHNRLAEGV